MNEKAENAKDCSIIATSSLSDKGKTDAWVHLTQEKSFSRLLYTNPVCFLTCFQAENDLSTFSPSDAPDDPPDRIYAGPKIKHLKKKNVMVLSWMTATNNFGKFVFSINRRRFSAKAMIAKESGIEFCLSVPVQGMEQLVINVGGTSSKWCSKFTEDHPSHDPIGDQDSEQDSEQENNKDLPKLQKYSVGKKRHKKSHEFGNGIPNLKAVSFGNDLSQNEKNNCFVIDGTVAHMKCRTTSIIDNVSQADFVDDQHYLVSAQIIDAYVQAEYWDEKKQQFRPRNDDTSPYLTFFGSQTFGYVVGTHNDRKLG